MKPEIPQEERLAEALRLFDLTNAEDPTRVSFEGKDWPYEVFYAEQVTKWVLRLNREASVALRLAARSQHLRRWCIPRNSYPMDRSGYLRWRADLKRFHAEESARILRRVGFDDDVIEQVQRLNLKSDLGRDAEMQVLEDALCLVTLEHQLSHLMRKHDEAKLVAILQRTWRKMSPAGQQASRAISFSQPERDLLEKALA